MSIPLIAHWLYTLDLTGSNPRNIPRKAESIKQKSKAMHPVLKWWYQRLCSKQLGDLDVNETEKQDAFGEGCEIEGGAAGARHGGRGDHAAQPVPALFGRALTP